MIKFFRNIRQNLIMENKTSKYLKYAIGEIVLVVIGILIALSINNWNENQQDKAKVDRLLKNIQKDIEMDVANIIDIIPYYATKDSIGRLVLNNSITEKDYKIPNIQYLHSLVLFLQPLNLKRGGYDKLMNVQEIIPEEYDTIVEHLNIQYDDHLKILEKTHDFLLEDVRNNDDYLFKNFEWYSSTEPNHLNQEKIDFFLNNIRYKGMVSKYLSGSTDTYIDQACIYLKNALDNYKRISKKLMENSLNVKLEANDSLDSKFLGSYMRANGDTLKIYRENNRIYVFGQRLTEIFPYAKNKLFTNNNYLRFEKHGDSLHMFVHSYEAGRKPYATRIN